MPYALGVDLGTTYTAAATARDGRVEIFSLGRHLAAVPSVVYAGAEGVLVGDPAVQRAVTEPERVAREFKRRVGDPVPLVLGGTPWSAEQLMARMLEWVLARVGAEEGSAPVRLVVSHPANWGRFKRDVLLEAVHLTAGAPPVATISEPEAAALHYASVDRVKPGSVIAVYDLGGGSFDVTVLRRGDDGFELVGQPDGVERLGGIDFDEVVYRHVLGHALDGAEPDVEDPTTRAALARVRQACVDAKETLSFDTRVTVPVVLPGVSTTVTVTRSEFEEMIGPPLEETVRALRRALDSARVDPEDLRSVLLVGGSSRIPLVGQLVQGALGRPVAVDAHPKHPVALGAARAAWEGSPRLVAVTPTPEPARWALPARWEASAGAAPATPATPPPATPPPAFAAPVETVRPVPAEPPEMVAETAPKAALAPTEPSEGRDVAAAEPTTPRWVVPVVTVAILVVAVVIAVLVR
jgi:molecular chaperone DnaK (HSP70)